MISMVILDGFGESKQKKGNAIKLAGTPFLDKLKSNYPNLFLKASGNAVGLPWGQMGNSEAGHLTIGAGRIVFQPLEIINNEIKNGSFFKNKQINRAIEYASESGGALHLIGLISDGGVHSHIDHLKAILTLAEQYSVEKVYIHCITDGRDSLKNSGVGFIKEIERFCRNKKGEIATICGRVFAMDRENRYDRIMKAYDCIVLGKAEHYSQNAVTFLRNCYIKRQYDEFIEPIVVGKPKTINSGDAVIFFNFRSDRMIELTNAITQKNFNEFPQKNFSNLFAVTMTKYSNELKNVAYAYPKLEIKNGLAETLCKNKKSQFHIAETTKYAHVTYYFNGGRENPFKNETRKLIETINDTDFTKHPKMRAIELTEATMEAVASGNYDFVLLNLSNGDMLGHTANIEATKIAVSCVDKCAYAVAMATLLAGGECIITADHGNAEKLLDKEGNPCTTHTTNPVPFILVTEKLRKLKKEGELANIAPTILDLMGIEKPSEMMDSLLE